MYLVVVVLPQPGPPVTTQTGEVAAAMMAALCPSDIFIVLPAPHVPVSNHQRCSVRAPHAQGWACAALAAVNLLSVCRMRVGGHEDRSIGQQEDMRMQEMVAAMMAALCLADSFIALPAPRMPGSIAVHHMP